MRRAKRNFRLDLDHYDEDLRFHGLKSITLNAGAMDPTRGREALSYAIFRAAGVPAPRTAFAEVTLTMPGKYDKEYLGLYTFVEHVDKSFLKDRFKNGKGLLMKPEKLRDIQYLGEDWDKYKAQYRPKREPSKKEAKRVIAFARLVNKADDEQFRKEIGTYLDVDQFLRFIAANALVANLDSFFTLGHNYYIYLNPETNRFVFLPWDLDLSLAGFPMAGSPDKQMDLSLTHPHARRNKLIDRLLAMKEVQEQYRKILKDLATTCFTKEKLLKEIDAIEQVTREPLAREKKAAEARTRGRGASALVRREAACLAPPRRCEPSSRSAPPRSRPSSTAPARAMSPRWASADRAAREASAEASAPACSWPNPCLRPLIPTRTARLRKEFVEGARRFFKECDQENKGSLDEKALADGIKRLLPPPPGFGGAPPPFPGGGPGRFLAGAIFKKAETEKNGKLTLLPFLKVAELYFQEWDKDGSGALDEKEIAAAINQVIPPPPGFGPPGFGPPPRPDDPFKKKENP